MKITVVKEFTFDAAHYLPGHEGKCQHLHGHHYILQVGVKGKVHPETGMVIDFGDLKDTVEYALAGLDHCYLNDLDTPGFPNYMPTAENMVLWMVKNLQPLFAGDLSFLRLYETPTSYAEWRAE